MSHIDSEREESLPDAVKRRPLILVPATPHIDPPELPVPPWMRPVDRHYDSGVNDLPLSRLLGECGPRAADLSWDADTRGEAQIPYKRSPRSDGLRHRRGAA